MTDDNFPNVLFVFTDQQRYDWATAGDVPVRTPNLDRLADRGVAFTDAVCPSPLCAPSRACLASGMEYDRAPSVNPEFPSSGPELPDGLLWERLRDEAGYHVAGCGKFLDKFFDDWGRDGRNRIEEYGFSDGVHNAGKWGTAWDVAWEGLPVDEWEPEDPYMADLDRRGLAADHLLDYRRRQREGHFTVTDPTPLPDDAYCDSWLAERGLELLDDAPADNPWHLFVSFVGPHDPLDVTEEMHGWYRDPDAEFPEPVEGDEDVDPETHQEVRRNYAAMIENVDRWLGRYLDAIEERGELDETLVVFASDHGEMLGDHGRWKKHAPYHASVGVPLVAAGPGVESRDPVDAPQTILDLHATFLDYAGLDAGAVDSRSLRPVLEGDRDPADHRDAVYVALGPWRLAYDGRHKLIEGYETDPKEAWDFGLGDKDQVRAFEAADRDPADYRDDRPRLLFDRAADPHETENLAADRPGVVEELATWLDERR